ncbi:MAG: carboxypeptidase regulatory-like domain-containing protein [Chitinophagaceae bacterium]|nr:carboxypeptidase regulatory-like domain-containing protein [Chitinophagaceae bacterium]
MKRLKTILVLIVLLPLSGVVLGAPALNTGKDPILLGYVVDASSKKPLKGVAISVASSGSKKPKTFTTDEKGNFAISELPVGEVTIILEKKGYKTYRSEKLVLKEGMQVRLNFDISNEEPVDDVKVFHPLLRMMEW